MVDIVRRIDQITPLQWRQMDDNLFNLKTGIENAPVLGPNRATPVNQGGTGANTPEEALVNLGAYPALNPTKFITYEQAPVQTVGGFKDNVTLEQLKLDRVDNVHDLDKPISNATQAALNLKFDLSAGNQTNANLQSEIQNRIQAINDEIVARNNAINVAISAEQNTRSINDQSIRNDLTNALNNAIAQNTTDWQNADALSYSNLISYVNNAVNKEIADRQTAVNSEASARDSQVKSLVNSEAQARTEADNALTIAYQAAIATATTNAVNGLLAGVPTSGNTLEKLYNYIVSIQKLLTSNNVDLDTMQELVNAITSDEAGIAALAANKINYTDIQDNVTSNLANAPLSANQGRILSGLIGTEITNRTNAINTEVTNRNNAINTSVSNEATLRANADALLQPLVNKNASGGYVGMTGFGVNVFNAAGNIVSHLSTNANQSREYTFPDKNGTVALTSDITGINSGTNTGDETRDSIVSKIGYTPANLATLASSAFTDTTNASNISAGTLPVARLPGFTGDATVNQGSSNIVLVNTGVTPGSYGANNSIPTFSVDGKGRIVNAGSITPSGTWNINVTGSAGSVAWSNVSGRPGYVSQFTNDSGYINGSGSCNYANSSNYSNSSGVANSLNSGYDYRMRSLGVGTGPTGYNGEIVAAGNITGYYSDGRLKDILGSITNALAKVHQLNGVIYHANEEATKYGYDSSIIEVGLIAQELEKVLPEVVVPAPFDLMRDDKNELVSKSGQDYKTVRYERIVSLLVEAIKELDNKVEKSISDFDNRLSAIEKTLNIK